MHGCPSASITTPQSSLSPPSINGGSRWAGTDTPRPGESSSPPTEDAPTVTAPGCGNLNSPDWPAPPDWISPPATTRPARVNGTRSNTDASPGSPLDVD